MIVPVVGSTPGRRYGHSIIFAKPHLLVFGGNTGSEPVNDVWCLSVEKAPFSWAKLNCGTDVPAVRVYHSAALCMNMSANGIMVVFGGRTADSSALNDTWGLRRHRDGRWDWVKAPFRSLTFIQVHNNSSYSKVPALNIVLRPTNVCDRWENQYSGRGGST